MPADLLHPRGDPLQHVARGEIDQPLEEIEPHAADAGFVHPFQLVVGHLFADKGDALGAAVGGVKRIDHGAVVFGVTRGLDDHILIEAEKVAQREQLLLRRITGRVFALRRIGKFRLGAEHMTMGIDGARRRFEFRFRRIGMERNVTRRHRHVEFLLLVIPGRATGANPQSMTTDDSSQHCPETFLKDRAMDSGLLAELVIGPATSGRTHRLGPEQPVKSSPKRARPLGRHRRTSSPARACRRVFPVHARR